MIMMTVVHDCGILAMAKVDFSEKNIKITGPAMTGGGGGGGGHASNFSKSKLF